MKSLTVIIIMLMHRRRWTAKQLKHMHDLFSITEVNNALERLFNAGYIDDSHYITLSGEAYITSILSISSK